ncbi:UDP-N-acetylmuramyl-tripeptide synthetase [Lachnospiraceae bacterium 46-15]
MKNIKQYLDLLMEEGLVVSYNLYQKGKSPIYHMTYGSGDAKEDTLFLCKGAAFKKDYLMEALQRGAVAYVSEQYYDTEEEVPYIRVKSMRKAMPVLAKAFYGNPDEKLFLTGVTGTKGKTTTVYYIRAILDEYLGARQEKASGLISTIETCDGAACEESKLTTPESPELFRHLKNAVDAGMSHMTMEVSSQALKYHRVRKIKFNVGVFLNISEDHISPTEHEDFEDYFSAKLSLFKQTKTACVNLDSDQAKRVLAAARISDKVITFGTKGSPDILGSNIRMKDGMLSFDVECREFRQHFTLAMHGMFNVENALAAIAAAYAMGIPVKYMAAGLAKTKVQGRMEEYVSADGRLQVIVDFAHNRLSFEKLFDSVLMEHPDARIVTIFGCPGGKAFNRRRDLGLIAGLFSEKVYLSADDPGIESPQDIAREIGGYLEVTGCPYEYIEDRGQAIQRAIQEVERKTVLLVLGKGNEARQKYGKISYKFPTDGEFVQIGIREYNRRHMLQSAIAG